MRLRKLQGIVLKKNQVVDSKVLSQGTRMDDLEDNLRNLTLTMCNLAQRLEDLHVKFDIIKTDINNIVKGKGKGKSW